MKQTGIYKITCVVTGKVYVGSACNIAIRWKGHVSDLNLCKHHSRKLQRAWNKYGESAFIFEVLELCNKEDLLLKEQYYLDLYEAVDKGFNICKNAASPLGIRRSKKFCRDISKRMQGKNFRTGVPHTEETKEKIRESNRNKKRSEKTREAMRQAAKLHPRKNTFQKGHTTSMEIRVKISHTLMLRKEANNGKT